MKLLEQQQCLLSSIEQLRNEADVEHQRLSCRATILKETLSGMENLNDTHPHVQSEAFYWLDLFSTQFLDLEAKKDFLLPFFDGTATIFESFSAINDAINLFKSMIETAFAQLPSLFAIVAREFYSTEMLCAQTADAISPLADVVSTVQRSIAVQRSGVLHPLRRLPEEILIQIFECCAAEEAHRWLGISAPPNLKVVTRIAAVCRRWRGIALNCPRLWRHLLAPAYVKVPITSPRENTFERRGIDHIRRALQLCGVNVELTIPTRFAFPPDIDITTLEVGRLNILDASQAWPSGLPSPKHLWLGQAAPKRAPPREIPLQLISNTSKITCSRVSLRVASSVVTVTHLVLRGRQSTLPLNTLLCSLPQLVIFDAVDAWVTSRPDVNTRVQPHIHSQLQTFGVGGTGLAFLGQALAGGLRLPNLRLFEIAHLDPEQLATDYPSVSTHMSGYITHLSIFGRGGAVREALRAFIDTFPRLETLLLHGAATEPVLQAFYCTASSDGDNAGFKYSLPKTVQSVMISDYQENGEVIYERLHQMLANPAPNGESIKVIFQDCLNISPYIRKELCSPLAIQLTGSARQS